MNGTVKREVTGTEISQEVERVGYRYITHRNLTTHPGDWYLKVVYAYKDMEDGSTEYAVWLYNATYNGLSEGYYTKNRDVALIKFTNKK